MKQDFNASISVSHCHSSMIQTCDNPISSLPLPVHVRKAGRKPSDNYFEDFGISRQQMSEDIACKLGRHPKHTTG